MIRVIAKIKAKDKESEQNIKAAVKSMINIIPVKLGEYWVYGMVPLEFEEIKE